MNEVKTWWESLSLIRKANIIDYKQTDYTWDSLKGVDKALIKLHKAKELMEWCEYAIFDQHGMINCVRGDGHIGECVYPCPWEEKKMTIERKEFSGNVAISISDNEVRVWVCNTETGENIFRFKATGKVYHGQTDITVIGKQ